MGNNSGFKGVISNFAMNTVAYALPVILQQFLVFPLLARKLGAEVNGLFLSLLALNYFVINITASVLVNDRMLQNEKYERYRCVGDFNVLLLIFAVVDVVVVLIGSFLYSGPLSITDILLSIILILLFLFHDYIYVQYRIELRFNKILINNILLCLGYIIGLGAVYFIAPYWQFVFIGAYTLTFFYDFRNTTYIREPFRITPLFGDTVKQYFILMGATALSAAVTYGDRLLLYPLLDGTSVSVFISAQLIGKMMQMLSTPITSFLLAYLIKKTELRLRITAGHIVLFLLGCIALYGICVIISKPLIGFLYPNWAEESLNYVGLTAINGIILMFCTIINVLMLRFCDNKYQIIKSALYLFAYVGCSFTLVKIAGLWGFCIGNLIASVVQGIYLMAVVMKNRIILLA